MDDTKLLTVGDSIVRPLKNSFPHVISGPGRSFQQDFIFNKILILHLCCVIASFTKTAKRFYLIKLNKELSSVLCAIKLV